MVKILIADSLSEEVVKTFQADGYIVRMDPTITDKTLPNEIQDNDILIVRSTKVTRETIDKATNLSLIVRAGAGVNTIDIKAASEKGIYVTNTPGCNADAVAELTIGQIIACDRQIVQNAINLRNGKWTKKKFLNSPGLKGRTLGLLGAGNVAQRVMKIAHAIGMNIIVWSYFFDDNDAERLGVTRVLDKMDVAKNADVISVHIPYMKDTHHSISKEFFDAMKPGAIFINTARGEIVDTEALKNAIKEKGIRVGVDVFENEPTSGTADFNQVEYAKMLSSSTCHIGGSTLQASELIAHETIRVVETYIKKGEPLNCVNIEAAPQCDEVLSIRHTGVLPKILQYLSDKNAEILSLNNKVLSGGGSQTCNIRIKCKNCNGLKLNAVNGVLSVVTTSE
ncbi:hypothetical protein M9Y10_030504 [Tritrichomonas musculus]|uniref:D-3-phosphoglycerate dehydrogenase n=1 Tax=Tritrichomonas musculus TaxID=1915356 RepID=A0ABR2GLN1_9EUKA